MAMKKPAKGSIHERWANESPAQFKTGKATAKTLKDVEKVKKMYKKSK